MTPDKKRELYRWGSSGAAVVAAHLAFVAYVLSAPRSALPAAPPAAIVIELAPVAAAPEVPQMDLPPAPEQPDSEDVPDQPVEEIAETEPEPVPEPPPPEPVKEPPPPETPPVPEPEVPLPPPPPEKKPETKVEPPEKKVEPPKKKPPQKPSVAAAPRPQPVQARATAPVSSASDMPSNAIPNWRSLVAAILERNKRYPSEARSRGDRGTATVQFTINRGGGLMHVSLLRSSGSQILDGEAVALVQRAQPFPPPPPEMRGNTITLAVPVRFSFR